MKKASFIIIGLALTIFVTGHFFIFQLTQNVHQNKFRSFVLQNSDQAIQIDISPSELYTSSKNIKWLDDNKEVMIDGQVYDVVGFKNSGISVSLFLINDSNEKSLMDSYSELTNALNNTSSPGSVLIKNFLSLKYLQDPVVEILNPIAVFMTNHSDHFSKLSSVFISTENPPPLV